MAETKTLTREYIIPLRKAWINAPEYKRAAKAVKEIKKFIAKHMKVAERDVSKVKLDVYLNNDLWFRGRSKPPARIKVKAIKEGEIVKVGFVTVPEYVSFLQSKNAKFHKKVEKKKDESAETKKKEEQKEVKTEEQKKDESEKEKAVEQLNIKEAKLDSKAEKHTTKPQKVIHPQRMALKK